MLHYLVGLRGYGGSDDIGGQEGDFLIGQTQEWHTGVMNRRVLIG